MSQDYANLQCQFHQFWLWPLNGCRLLIVISCDQHLQLPIDFPIYFSCRKPPVELANGNHVILGKSECRNWELVAKCPKLQSHDYGDAAFGIHISLAFQCYCKFSSRWLIVIKDYLYKPKSQGCSQMAYSITHISWLPSATAPAISSVRREEKGSGPRCYS